jgi:hypothetical protein
VSLLHPGKGNQSRSGKKSDTFSPDTNKLDINVSAEAFLECVGLLPSDIVRAGVHFVRKWHLLDVAGWKETHFVYHTRKRTSRVSASAEAKDTDTVSLVVWCWNGVIFVNIFGCSDVQFCMRNS